MIENKLEQRKKQNRYIIITTVLVGIVLLAMAWQLTVPVISDETTTMANAAWLGGYDWHLMVTSLGGLYYRFGQALLTIPFFAFLKDPDMIYRLSMVLQSMIQVSTVPVVYVICQRHLSVKSEKIAALVGAAVCLVPSIALYVFYYRGDFLLSVLPWYVLLAFFETIRAAEQDKELRRALWTIAAVFFAVYSYTAHTRGIVVLIALLLTAIAVRIFLKKKSISWMTLAVVSVICFAVDSCTGQLFKSALYSISGLNANALESTDMKAYFSFFSYDMLKDLFMLCISWLHTLLVSGQGLVLIGIVVSGIVVWKLVADHDGNVTDNEKVSVLFCLLVFLGYYAVGALFFKGTYLSFATGTLEKRVDRLLYDRYAICGAGMIIFVALYALCIRKDWIRWKGKIFCGVSALAVFFVWFQKILPLAVKYKGYLYNTIILNTFQKIKAPEKIMWGQKYGREALLAISLLGIGLMFTALVLSCIKKKWAPYVLLSIILVSDLVLIQVNFVKVRKATNDYTMDATAEVVDFMQEFEEEITQEYPYVLKGKLSGIKIQFYQSQLMSYQMFGKEQEEELGLTDYFIISDHDDIDLTWYEGDYYLFADFDYENAKYDIIYVKGEGLKNALEELGYEMTEYLPENKRLEGSK